MLVASYDGGNWHSIYCTVGRGMLACVPPSLFLSLYELTVN